MSAIELKFAEILCPDPAPEFANAERGVPTGYGVGATTVYVCEQSRYRFLDGHEAKTLTCSHQGEWQGINSDCQSGRCPPLELQENTEVASPVLNASLGSLLHVRCAMGHMFAIIGTWSYDVTCSPDLTWQGVDDIPPCISKSHSSMNK